MYNIFNDCAVRANGLWLFYLLNCADTRLLCGLYLVGLPYILHINFSLHGSSGTANSRNMSSNFCTIGVNTGSCVASCDGVRLVTWMASSEHYYCCYYQWGVITKLSCATHGGKSYASARFDADVSYNSDARTSRAESGRYCARGRLPKTMTRSTTSRAIFIRNVLWAQH